MSFKNIEDSSFQVPTSNENSWKRRGEVHREKGREKRREKRLETSQRGERKSCKESGEEEKIRRI